MGERTKKTNEKMVENGGTKINRGCYSPTQTLGVEITLLGSKPSIIDPKKKVNPLL